MEGPIVPGRSTGDIRTINHKGSKSQFPDETQDCIPDTKRLKNVKDKGFSQCFLCKNFSHLCSTNNLKSWYFIFSMYYWLFEF